MEELFDKLAYLTTKELWGLLATLGMQYYIVEMVEEPDKTTGENHTIPKVVFRTDYENMKSDIYVRIAELSEGNRKFLLDKVDEIIADRIRDAAASEQ